MCLGSRGAGPFTPSRRGVWQAGRGTQRPSHKFAMPNSDIVERKPKNPLRPARLRCNRFSIHALIKFRLGIYNYSLSLII